MRDDHPEHTGTGLDPVLSVLIAQLRRNGLLSGADIGNMQRRLIEADRPHLAAALAGVVLSDMLDDPHERRAAIHVMTAVIRPTDAP